MVNTTGGRVSALREGSLFTGTDALGMAAGNGVVPHQAVAAFRHLLPLLDSAHQSAA